jgi:dGTPase
LSRPLRDRVAYEAEEDERLGPWAQRAASSRGRVVAEPEHAYRTAFQRDRDRIVHSRAFRRLEYKTQVFVHHEGDHYRNRLTHTLEGSQIARTIARALRANEDLAEAVALAHDLGHTPFGHAGEAVLDRLLESDGGFDHNRQTLRIVDLLEERYPGFRGLNLTAETREGFLKHGRAFEHPVPLPPATPSPGLEAQIADASDEIAYTSHDLDDGLRSGLLRPGVLADAPLFGELRRSVESVMAGAPERVLRSQTLVALTNRLVTDLVEATASRLRAVRPASAEEVRAHPERLVALSPATGPSLGALKDFLFENLYHHPDVLRMSLEAGQVLGDLFRAFREDPRRLPDHVRARFAIDGEARAIADYVAGMTDRFALAEHHRLREPEERRPA